ncbi:uncharacterized protein LOC144283277 isoform X5 [Canis aureus]
MASNNKGHLWIREARVLAFSAAGQWVTLEQEAFPMPTLPCTCALESENLHTQRCRYLQHALAFSFAGLCCGPAVGYRKKTGGEIIDFLIRIRVNDHDTCFCSFFIFQPAVACGQPLHLHVFAHSDEVSCHVMRGSPHGKELRLTSNQ